MKPPHQVRFALISFSCSNWRFDLRTQWHTVNLVVLIVCVLNSCGSCARTVDISHLFLAASCPFLLSFYFKILGEKFEPATKTWRHMDEPLPVRPIVQGVRSARNGFKASLQDPSVSPMKGEPFLLRSSPKSHHCFLARSRHFLKIVKKLQPTGCVSVYCAADLM